MTTETRGAELQAQKKGARQTAHATTPGEIQALRRTVQAQAQQIAELKHALESKSDERAKAMADAQAMTHIGSWQWDIASDTVTWSDELYRLHGLKPQNRPIDYATYLSTIHPAFSR